VRLVQRIREEAPAARVVGLVPSETRDKALQGVAAGIHACLLEEAELEELEAAIACVAGGGTYCSSDLVQSLFQQVGKLARSNSWPDAGLPGGLTKREHEILGLMSGRMSNKEIAKELCVSLYTVKNHVHNILEKLEVDSRFAAVEIARERSWLSR
jgi:DNA-binding NarL/FixJ family response regulator